MQAAAYAVECDNSDRMMQESAERALAILDPGKNPFHVGNDRKRVDINVFHDRAGHLSEPILRESARQRGITPTGRMEPCTTCIPARGTRADVPKRGEGRAGKAPGDLLHIDMCGPYTTTIGGNHYMFYAVDAATGYIANYALRRKSDAVAVFRRCIVDLAHKAGTRIRCVRGDCDALWTSKDFRDFCSTMGIAVQHSPPGAQQYNGVVENAIQRSNKIAMASRRAAERRLGPGGFSCVRGLDARGDKLWAESAKDAAQKLNQAASPSNPGRASPQELFTGNKGAFLVVPFSQYGFMYRERRSKLDDKAGPCCFLNAGDNHGDCCVKILRADTGRACYSSNVAWAPLPQSGRGGVQ